MNKNSKCKKQSLIWADFSRIIVANQKNSMGDCLHEESKIDPMGIAVTPASGDYTSKEADASTSTF